VVQRQKKLTIDPATGQPTEKYATFSRNIWSPLRNLFAGTNSNFSESHANWIKSYDANTDSMMWFGPSAYKAALYARNDANQYPWTAALGLTNGELANIVDLAINPNQRELDLITRIGLNPIVRFPNSGNVVWNTLTLQKEQSALQENYIRRGLLWLGNALIDNSREFIGQPNTIITRTRVKNKLNPILQYMKDNDGVYTYQVICDERNNSAESIDRGELRIAVYVQPTRTIKQILIDIVVDRTGATSNVIV
jgi:phage tail sheath protein FI